VTENQLNEGYELETTELTHAWRIGPVNFSISLNTNRDSKTFVFNIFDICDLIYVKQIQTQNLENPNDPIGSRLDMRLDLNRAADISETLSFINQAIDMMHKMETKEIPISSGIDIIKNLSFQFTQSLEQDFDDTDSSVIDEY